MYSLGFIDRNTELPRFDFVMRSFRFWFTLTVACWLQGSVTAADSAAGPTPSKPDPKAQTTAAAKPVAVGGGFTKWQSAAENGEVWAQFNLGLAYHLGKGVPKSELEAVRWYKAAADAGYAPAQANLGYCYDTGFGVAVEPAEAVKWYQLAAVQGNAFAQYNLAKKYQSGPGVPLDPKSAEKWFLAAAQQNFVPAFFSLGQIYANEFTRNPNYPEALKWFRLAAEQGFAPAQHAIGYLYASGKSGQTNYFEAVKWYTLAASRDFADSHYNLGLCYEFGLGVPQNLIAAVNHYRTAADAGHPQAQYSLGVCYYEGKGVETNLIEAYKWWNLATVQGIPEASSNREILTRLMKPEDIREAQRLASEFTVKPSRMATESRALLQTASAEGTEVKRVATGFIISSDGYLVTNFRAISGATSLTVVTESGTFAATPYRAEPLNDIAILKIEGAFRPLPIGGSRQMPVDAPLIIVGFDGPNHGVFNPKVARGKLHSLLGIQADPRQFSIEPHLPETYAGSAVLNGRGQVIATMLSAPTPNAGQTEGTAETASMSYAIKSDHLISILTGSKEINWILDESKVELTPEEVVSRARAGTVLVLVL